MLNQLGLLALLALWNGAAAAALTQPKCADVAIITVRGSTEYQSDNPVVADNGAEIVDTVLGEESPMRTGEGEMSLIAQGVQNSTEELVINRQALIYPAIIETPTDYFASFSNGTESLIKVIKASTKQCKDQKLVLLGFSQGAHVIGDVLCGGGGGIWGPVEKPKLDPETYSKSIAAVIMWGDPRHNQTGQDKFVDGEPDPEEDGYFARTEGQNAILTKYYADKLVSYCNDNDKYCASGSLGKNQIAANNESSNIHSYSYMKTAVQPAIKFIKEQIKDIEPKSGSTNPSEISTATASGASETGTSTSSSASATTTGSSGAGHLAASVTGTFAIVSIILAKMLFL